ncbi:hypothetical protein RLOatenuis_3970 [Rickettsiales bacterium]|nr:hypothetical protein RLOatenuis_3970 [Rickettsiales bacterium]
MREDLIGMFYKQCRQKFYPLPKARTEKSMAGKVGEEGEYLFIHFDDERIRISIKEEALRQIQRFSCQVWKTIIPCMLLQDILNIITAHEEYKNITNSIKNC